MAKKIIFSNIDTRKVFEEVDFDGFKTLMYDTGLGKQQKSKDEANDKIREIMFDVLGVAPDCSRKELHRAIRRHKIDIFEVIEDTVEDLLVSGWGNDPFFEEFVEFRAMSLGDTNEFYVPDQTILTVAELSGGHHDISLNSVRVA